MTGFIVAVILTACAFALGIWVGFRAGGHRAGSVIAEHAHDCVVNADSPEQRKARAHAYRDLFLAMGVPPSNNLPKE